MRAHRRLKTFELADALVVEIYRATKSFPMDELYGLTCQLRRAAVSVPTNIVEGCGRGTPKEYLHFLRVAFASLREVGYLLDLACRLGCLDAEQNESLQEQYDTTARTLGALVQSQSS